MRIPNDKYRLEVWRGQVVAWKSVEPRFRRLRPFMHLARHHERKKSGKNLTDTQLRIEALDLMAIADEQRARRARRRAQ